MNKIRIPKCLESVNGKHKFEPSKGTWNLGEWYPAGGSIKKCTYCGMYWNLKTNPPKDQT